jgi:hypothetical protein
VRAPKRKGENGDYFWSVGMVRQMLGNRSYVGDVVNFRTYSKSYKLKKRIPNPEENWEIHENVHEAIIPRPVWEQVRRTFGHTKCRQPKGAEKHMLAGYLFCSDCGASLNYKRPSDKPWNEYFSCHNNRQNNGLCQTTHHIRVDNVTDIVTHRLRNIIGFASMFEDEFVKLIVDEQYRRVQLRQKKNQHDLNAALARDKEINRLYERIYEDQALGKLPEERFLMLAAKYDEEQAALRLRIRNLRKIVEEEKAHELNAEGFLARVRLYTDGFEELTPEILRLFIDKVVVYHRVQVQGVMEQQVDVYYKLVGKVDVPQLAPAQLQRFQASFGREKDKRTAA